MKKIFCLLFIAFLFVQFSSGQKKAKPSVRKPVPVSASSEAEKAWIPFYAKFREIVMNKDPSGLEKIISDDFNSTFGEGKDEYLGTMNRGEDYDYSRWKKIEGMRRVSKLLSTGSDYYQSKKYLRKIVGEKWYDNGRERSVCKNSRKEDPCGPESLAFEFRSRSWWLITTYFCECE